MANMKGGQGVIRWFVTQYEVNDDLGTLENEAVMKTHRLIVCGQAPV